MRKASLSLLLLLSSCAGPSRLEEGRWTGALTPMNHPEIANPVAYEVRYEGDILAIELIGPGGELVQMRETRLDGDTLFFAFDEPEEQVPLECSLARDAAGAFAGRWMDVSGKWARFTMVPPGRGADAWTHSIAIEADDFEDLAFLGPLLEGKRIVQLGENAHGIREYNLVKSRIVRFLHQELGFGVLAFESPLYQCYDAELTAGDASAMSTLTSCAIGVWHTKEVLPLFEYLRETRKSDRPLRLAGIDVQPIGRNKAGRPAFLSSLIDNPAYSAEVFALDSTFLEVYGRGGRERRAFFRSEEGQRMAEAYDHLATILAAMPSEAAGVARQTASSMAWYIRQQSAPTTRDYVERRDRGMAENLMFLIEELYSNEKVIVWGHNFHVRHDNLAIPPDSTMFPDVAARTMGTWIRERYSDEVYTVGLYAYGGRAANNSGDVYEIEPADPGSLEALLHEFGEEALFVELDQAPDNLAEPITARYNATTPLSMILRDQYDAIIFVDEVTPRVMLY
jgi:erythromycin esterase